MFLTHGEPLAAEALYDQIDEQLGWNVAIPQYGEKVALSPSPDERLADD